MKKQNKKLTGVFAADNKTYAFYLDNYCITFLDSSTDMDTCYMIKSDNCFINGVTHDGSKIMLYVGKGDLHLKNTMQLNFSSYIVSESDRFDQDHSFFDGIVFVGGTLNNLKRPKAFDIKYDDSTRQRYIQDYDDSQKTTFETSEFKCDVTIGSIIQGKYGNDGITIKNDEVYFEMMFDKSQPTLSVYDHYKKLKEIMSFLTYRENVDVDEIHLIKKTPDFPIPNLRVAQVFINTDDKLTEKEIYYNLEFSLIDSSLSSLMTLFYNTKEKKPSYSLDIYPENDDKVNYITNDKVKAVCSALECEIAFVKSIKSDEADKIKKLKNKIKPIIEEHKKSDDKLLDRTYSLIETSMQHWSMTASDKIKSLYHMHEIEMSILNKSFHQVEDDDIDNFVKYRNHITHGSYRIMDLNISLMTRLLSGLVYCCVLTRIGVSADQIIKWCEDEKLLR